MDTSGVPDIAKIRWRCRRGTKELDVLTTRYLEHFFQTASRQEQHAFARLLELQDPDLYLLLSRKSKPHDVLQASIIEKIHSL